MKFNDILIEYELDESKFGKTIAGLGLMIALLAGHNVDIKNLDSAHQVIRNELSQEIRDIIPEKPSKQARQAASREWSDIIQAAKKENPELETHPALYRAGLAIIQNPSLLEKK